MNDELDRLLKNWSTQQEPTTEQLEQLQQRVLAALPEHIDGTADKRTERRDALGGRVVKLTAAMLSLAALVTASLWIGTRTPSVDRVADFTHQKKLIANLTSVYERPLKWVAESSDDLQVELGESNEESEQDAQQPWLLIRLVVERSDRPNWQLDLAVRNQQTVNLMGRAQADRQVMVWPTLTEDGLVMIDTRMAALGPIKADINQSHLVRPGKPCRLTSGGGDYAVWQYVEVVDGPMH